MRVLARACFALAALAACRRDRMLGCNELAAGGAIAETVITSYTAFPIFAKISAVDVANSARQDATTVLDRTYWRVHKQVPRARIVSDSRRGTRQSTRQYVIRTVLLDSGRDFEVDVGKPR